MSSTVSTDEVVDDGVAWRLATVVTVRHDPRESLPRRDDDLNNISGFPARINSRQLPDYLTLSQSDE